MTFIGAGPALERWSAAGTSSTPQIKRAFHKGPLATPELGLAK